MDKQQIVLAMVVAPLRFEGEMHYPGDADNAVTLQMPRKEFDHAARFGAVQEIEAIEGVESIEQLIEHGDGAVAEAGTESTAAQPDGDQSDQGGPVHEGTLTIKAIAAKIVELDGQLKDSEVTESGAPKVSTLETVLECPVSAAQRDEAWALFQAEQAQD